MGWESHEAAREHPRGRTLLLACALGAYLAWENLYHDEGFLFLPGYLNQVESCVASYGGAFIACALIAGLRSSWRAHERRWLSGTVLAQGALGLAFYGAVYAQAPAGIVGAQLLLSTSFFIMLFFIMRALAMLPLAHAALLIAGGIGLYGLLECAVWALALAMPSLGLRFALHLGLLVAAFVCLRTGRVAANAVKVAPEPRTTSHRALPLPLLLHTGSYWFVFGLTHALASGVIPMGHDKLLPCYLGSMAASLVFYLVFARSASVEKVWPKVRACIFPLTMLSFLLLPFALSGFTFVSIGFAQCAMDTYLAFYLLATLVVARKIGGSFTRTALAAALLAVPFVIGGVIAGDALKMALPLSPLFYNALSVIAFALLAAGTFWVGDDRRAGLVWGLEKKLSPKRFEDKETTDRCAKAAKKFGLTKREAEILLFLAQGQSAAAIAESEVIALNTARTHIARIHRKMDVHNQQELLRRLREV
ncbi:helix-turn-helix transcriptional regulator [uncultured Adlercreutzia sp.]|uniref:helix-turn-helix transcriptional regulator n=1 Tax=uncultured Adlercreutzia sp. TaxID=875803 RepID=UPI00266DD050|nr:helix-turn-helix transcriptional regulator [uncultured Adlercreutzia sp.]